MPIKAREDYINTGSRDKNVSGLVKINADKKLLFKDDVFSMRKFLHRKLLTESQTDKKQRETKTNIYNTFVSSEKTKGPIKGPFCAFLSLALVSLRFTTQPLR